MIYHIYLSVMELPYFFPPLLLFWCVSEENDGLEFTFSRLIVAVALVGVLEKCRNCL